MEIKLVQGLQQKLVMTPQLQMAIKLLQLSRLELIDAVREEMMGNPILEDGADGNDPIERAAEAAETPTIDRVAALDDSRLHLPTVMFSVALDAALECTSRTAAELAEILGVKVPDATSEPKD